MYVNELDKKIQEAESLDLVLRQLHRSTDDAEIQIRCNKVRRRILPAIEEAKYFAASDTLEFITGVIRDARPPIENLLTELCDDAPDTEPSPHRQ
jgi:hypothetical protein